MSDAIFTDFPMFLLSFFFFFEMIEKQLDTKNNWMHVHQGINNNTISRAKFSLAKMKLK